MAFVELSCYILFVGRKRIVLFSLKIHSTARSTTHAWNANVESGFYLEYSLVFFIQFNFARSLSPFLLQQQRKKKSERLFVRPVHSKYTTITTIVMLWKWFSYSITLSAYLFLFYFNFHSDQHLWTFTIWCFSFSLCDVNANAD